MGPSKPKLGTKLPKESSMKKKVSGVPHKRIKMLRRRISNLFDEKESLEAKNMDLLENLNREKKLNAELQKDVFNWQRLYHEVIISQNTYKVRHSDSVQNLSSCLKELKSARPIFENLSNNICRNQIRLTNLLNAAHSPETENRLPRAFGDGGQLNSDLSRTSEKRMKHKVGPMVKGVLIQKPTIRLERVMLHQPQDQEHSSNNHTAEGGNTLTPITEENEQEANLHLEEISMRRRRKHRLGTGNRWRMRQQERMDQERHIERERERDSQRRSVSESSDSDDQLGPVIRLQRVSGLLLSPNLLAVGRGRPSDGKGDTSRSSESETRVLRTREDPMEGCSWMNRNPGHSKVKKVPEKRKEDTSGTSSSSDEDGNSSNAAAQKNMRSSFTDSLYANKTLTVQRKTSSSSSTTDTSRDTSNSSKVEPDSTNNVEEVVFGRPRPSSSKDSLGTSSSIVHSDSMSEVNGQENVNGRTTSGVDSLAAVNPDRSSQASRNSSSFCNNCTPIAIPEVQGKRIRKPKCHLYPGEEPRNSLPETKKRKSSTSLSRIKVVASHLSAGKKSLGKRLPKERKVEPIASSTPHSVAENHRPSQGSPSDYSQAKTKRGRPKKSSMKISSEVPSTSADQRTSEGQGRTSDSSQVKRKRGRPKRSSMKISSEVPSTSADQRTSEGQVSEESKGRNSRRKIPISYKEPSCNAKLRRLK